MRCFFCLDTTEDYFIGWLKWYANNWPHARLSSDELGVDAWDITGEHGRYEMEGVWLPPQTPDTVPMAHGLSEFGMFVRLSVVALTAQRIEVTVNYSAKQLEPIVSALLLDISLRWSNDTTQTAAGGDGKEHRPWEAVENARYREWLRLWWQGYDKGEIAREAGNGVVAKTVENVFYELRKAHGSEVVPTKRERDKMLRLKNKSG